MKRNMMIKENAGYWGRVGWSPREVEVERRKREWQRPWNQVLVVAQGEIDGVGREERPKIEGRGREDSECYMPRQIEGVSTRGNGAFRWQPRRGPNRP